MPCIAGRQRRHCPGIRHLTAGTIPPMHAHLTRRQIFCCLAPSQNEQYVRQDEGPVVIRPIAPQPPSWTEPVLAPQLPQDAGKKTLVLDLGAPCCCVGGCW